MDNSVEEESYQIWNSGEDCQLRNIFPEEIWIIIGNMLDQSTDLEKYCNASPYFRDLFLMKRVYFLFPEVFEILTKWEQARQATDIKASFYQNPANLLYLNCRSVCHSWRKEVDSFFQSHNSHFQTDPSDLNRQQCEKGQGTHAVFTHPAPSVSQQRLEIFVDHFEETHNLGNTPVDSKNPFLSRSITFEGIDNWTYISKEEERSNAARYWYGIDQLLSKYGHHLWYCDILLENRLDFLYQRNLSGWLKLMPNLRVLKICYGQKEKNFLDCPNELELWEEEIKEYPLPKLQHLQFLQVVGLPTPIFNELIRKNNHVFRLDVTPKMWKKKWLCEGYHCLHSVPLPRLRTLTLKISSVDDIEKLIASEEKWGLNTLDIGFVEAKIKDFVGCRVNWSRIFQILTEKWGNTLSDLSLHMYTGENQDDDMQYKNLQLNLPQLRRLKLMLPSWMPIDFILPLENSLEKLYVVVDGNTIGGHDCQQKVEKEEIQFVECRDGKWLESNLWNCFQNLQELHIETATCSCASGLHNDACSFNQYFYSRKQWRRSCSDL